MTVRVLHTEWARGWGGQEMRVLQEMRGMRERGIEVFLACPPDSRIAEVAGQNQMSWFPVKFRGTIDPGSFFAVWRLVRRLKIDIVNTHSGKDSWMAGLAAKCAGALFIRTQHFSKPMRRGRWHGIYHLADHVITTGELVRDELIRDLGLKSERVTSIPSGPDHRRFDPAQCDRKAERLRLGLADGQVAIGTLGTLTGRKGLLQLLPVMEWLAKIRSNTVLFIGGDGKLRGQLELYVQAHGLQGRVRFLGFMAEPAPYLSALDIFVMPSINEGLPQALMQALLMGLPAVATRVGSVEELNRGNMLTVPPGDSQALLDALDRLVVDSEFRASLAAKARAAIEGEFTEERMVEKTASLYQQLAKKSG